VLDVRQFASVGAAEHGAQFRAAGAERADHVEPRSMLVSSG
jgi:hypothetical protein